MDEALEEIQGNLDILNWWELSSSRFLVLANMARDDSTVTSKSSFSPGRISFEPHCSTLAPHMVETLVCTQDWLKGTHPHYFPQMKKKILRSSRDLKKVTIFVLYYIIVPCLL